MSPIAAFAGLLLIGGIWLSRRRRPNVTLDKNENLMKHTRDGFDVEDGTVSGNTYRTGAFTEDDGTLEESVDVMQETVKNKISQRFDRELEKVMNEGHRKLHVYKDERQQQRRQTCRQTERQGCADVH